MRVLHVINGLGAGGAERSLADMLPGLEAQGVEHTVVCFYHRAEGVEQSVAARYPIMFIEPRDLPRRVVALRKIIRARRPDIVHTTLVESDLVGRLAALRSGVRVLTSLVNTNYDEEDFADPHVNRTKLRFLQVVHGYTLRHMTAHVHAISEAVKESAIEHLGVRPQNITVIPRGRSIERLGVPGAARRAEVRRSLGIGEETFLLLNVARHEHPKGHAYLLDALEHHLADRPEMQLLIAGRRGTKTPEIERRCQTPQLLDRVRMLGHRDDVPGLLAAADVFVFPSLREGLGGAAIEASALAVPVVASDLPALREVVVDGETGILVPLRAPEAIAAAIRRLADDPALRLALGTAGRARFEAHFQLETTIAATYALYRAIVDDEV